MYTNPLHESQDSMPRKFNTQDISIIGYHCDMANEVLPEGQKVGAFRSQCETKFILYQGKICKQDQVGEFSDLVKLVDTINDIRKAAAKLPTWD